jgi:glutathione S-transferase
LARWPAASATPTPGLAPLERRQFADHGQAQADKVRELARRFDSELSRRPFVAGARFSIADITLLCALDFAKGLMKYKPAGAGLMHLQAWRERMAERPALNAAQLSSAQLSADPAAA